MMPTNESWSTATNVAIVVAETARSARAPERKRSGLQPSLDDLVSFGSACIRFCARDVTLASHPSLAQCTRVRAREMFFEHPSLSPPDRLRSFRAP